MDGKHR
jgi:hypothetical protein